jgi:hypothetical protein
MYHCKYCGADTELFVQGVPVCLECEAALAKHEAPKAERAPAPTNQENSSNSPS